MTKRTGIPRIETGVRNLDALFDGGLPKGSVTVIGGPPGSGKTILAQQICFHNASAERPRPLLQHALRADRQDAALPQAVLLLRPPRSSTTASSSSTSASILRTKGLERRCRARSWSTSRRSSRRIVVIDSFKVFDDLASVQGGAPQVRLRARRQPDGLGDHRAAPRRVRRPTTIETNPLFSIVDGLIVLSPARAVGRAAAVLPDRQDARHRPQPRRALRSSSPRAASRCSRRASTIQREPTAERPGRPAARPASPSSTSCSGDGHPAGLEPPRRRRGRDRQDRPLARVHLPRRPGRREGDHLLLRGDRGAAARRGARPGLGPRPRDRPRAWSRSSSSPSPTSWWRPTCSMMRERIEAHGGPAGRPSTRSRCSCTRSTDPQISREKIFQLAQHRPERAGGRLLRHRHPLRLQPGQPLRRRGDGGRRRHPPHLDRGGARAPAVHRGLQAPEHRPPQGPAQHGHRRRAASRSSRATARRLEPEAPPPALEIATPPAAPGFRGSTSSGRRALRSEASRSSRAARGSARAPSALQFLLEGARKRGAGPLRHARGGARAAARQRRGAGVCRCGRRSTGGWSRFSTSRGRTSEPVSS